MNRPETEPQFNPYTDEVELLADPVKPPIDDDPDILDASHNDDLEDLEFTLSDHEFNREPSYTEPFKEEPSCASSPGNKDLMASSENRRKAARRKGIIIGTAFVLVVLIIAVAVASSLSKRNNQSGDNELNASEAISEPSQNNIPASTEMDGTLFPASNPVDTSTETAEASPVAFSVEPPTTVAGAAPSAPFASPSAPFSSPEASPVASPLASPEASPIAAAIDTYAPSATSAPAPTGSPDCQPKALYIDKDCYIYGETIQVTFENCHRGQWDWVGLYREVEGIPLDLNANLMYWTYSCGNNIGPCIPTPDKGVLPIAALVEEGTYSFQLVEGVTPYKGMASTQVFRVATDCFAVNGGEEVEYDEAAIDGGPTNIPDEIMEEPEVEEMAEEENEEDEDEEEEKEAEWMDGN